MSNTYNPLIDVSFIDATNISPTTSTDDILATVVDANWGPVNTPTVVDRAGFRSTFSMQGKYRKNDSYANVMNYFDKGGTYVEAVRLGDNERQVLINFPISGETPALGMAASAEPYSTNKGVVPPMADPSASTGLIYFKYAGGIPGWLLMLPYNMPGTNQSGVNYVQLVYGSFTPIEGTQPKPAPTSVSDFSEVYESLVFTFTPGVQSSGISYFYADVINSTSTYFIANPANATTAAVPVATVVSEEIVAADVTPIAPSTMSLSKGARAAVVMAGTGDTYYTVEQYVSAYEVFANKELSVATIICSPIYGATPIQIQIMAIGAKRMDLNPLVGSNDTAWVAADGGVTDPAYAYFNTNLAWDKFTLGIHAQERYQLGNMYFKLDGTYGWAGRITSVAAALSNRNQLPSYKAYGAYPGTLLKTLNFTQVVDLHDKGIGSIYKSVAGNFIFDVRSMNQAQTSYFAMGNVMRVTAAILRNTFQMVEAVIHTDVAANPQSRFNLQARLNSMLGEMVARSEIKSQSFADCGDSINSDALTNGGRILNIEMNVWYIGLTERVRISIIARDDSAATVTLEQVGA